MKRCSKCGEFKPLDAFYEAKGTRDGLRGDCKDCFSIRAQVRYAKNRERNIARVKKWQEENPDRVRASRKKRYAANPERAREEHLRRKFGLTLETYAELLAAQGGGCAICDDPEAGASHHVDHDPVTGEVRGILCVRCNNALGQFKENPTILANALRYLLTYERGAALRTRELTRGRAAALRKAG